MIRIITKSLEYTPEFDGNKELDSPMTVELVPLSATAMSSIWAIVAAEENELIQEESFRRLQFLSFIGEIKNPITVEVDGEENKITKELIIDNEAFNSLYLELFLAYNKNFKVDKKK